MDNANFEINDIPHRAKPEKRLFDKCLEIAARGEDTEFSFFLNEPISVPHTPNEGARPRLFRDTLRLDMSVPIFGSNPEGRILMRTDRHDGPATQDCLWAKQDAYLGTGIEFGKDGDLHETLRRICVDWAEREVERNLNAGKGIGSFSGVASDIRDQVEDLAVFVDEGGNPTLARVAIRVPRLTLVENEVMGGDHYINLVASKGGPVNWINELCSFPLGDVETARFARDRLVALHCPLRDPHYGYDWMDTKVYAANSRDEEIGRSPELLALDDTDRCLLRAVRGLAEKMSAAGLMTLVSKADIESIVREGGDVQELVDVIARTAQENEQAYGTFLREAGWKFGFDPLDVADARIAAVARMDMEAKTSSDHVARLPRF